MLLVITGLSSFTDSRPATSRPSYVVPSNSRSGPLPASIWAAMAAAAAGPWSFPPRSPVA